MGVYAHCFAGCCLQDQLCGREPGLSDEMHSILQELTTLSRQENAKVALRARQVSEDNPGEVQVNLARYFPTLTPPNRKPNPNSEPGRSLRQTALG